MTEDSEQEKTTADVAKRYGQRIEQHDLAIGQFESQWKRLALIRGVTFLASVTLLVFGFASAWNLRITWFVLSGLIFAVFLIIVFVHEGIESNLRRSRVWLRLARWSLARWRRDWDKLKETKVEVSPEFLAVSTDLDLFGKSSLFQLIGGVETPQGVELMRSWLVSGADIEEVRSRQTAIKELNELDDFREQLRFSCHLLADGDGGPEALQDWTEAPRNLDQHGILVGIARALAVAMLLGLFSVITGIVPLTWGGPYLIGVLTLNFLMTVIFAGRIHTLFNQVSTRHGEINHYVDVYRLIERQDVQSPLLMQLKTDLFNPSANVLRAKGQLGTIAWMANLRRHGILFIAYLVFQFLFLWDFHVLNLLQRWKAKYGSHVRSWLRDLGHWEVLAAISQLSVDHPQWAFPNLVKRPKAEVKITCRALGHPLLKNDVRVCNDVEVGPGGTVLLVTGSNMSGKSTLLRAIGVNTVLAQMGSPVCASEMSLSPVRIESSMRIQDSLADGVSFFMAELKRLKQIVDVAASYEQNADCTVLFLLDEVLQGTNSRERHIAVTRVICHLIDHCAIGAVSTHDLDLGKTAELAQSCRPVHFRESFTQLDGRKVMSFDYRMHEGIATTTNALELLKIVGLDEPHEGR